MIQTGNGGNPLTESGWTGWTAMDNGTAVSNANSVLQIAPCFQTGVLAATIGGSALTPPNGDDGLVDFCSTQTDVVLGAARFDGHRIAGGDGQLERQPCVPGPEPGRHA